MDAWMDVCRIQVTQDGKEAILNLANGDMRRVLNLLQATSMANPQVTEQTVYMCAGSPLPEDLEAIVHSLLNDGFQDAYNNLRMVITCFVTFKI